MEALVLASGSSGNAVLITSGETSLLIDAGISALQVRRRLEAFGRLPVQIDAILLTHEHSDHVRGLDVFLRRHHSAPVWATGGTWSMIGVRSNQGGELRSGRTRRFGSFRVTPVLVLLQSYGFHGHIDGLNRRTHVTLPRSGSPDREDRRSMRPDNEWGSLGSGWPTCCR